MGTSKNSIKAMMARRNQAKKRSLHGVDEHFEPGCNAASAPSVNF
jgi:triphosphoribosyl-dephospho-CoA synthase